MSEEKFRRARNVVTDHYDTVSNRPDRTGALYLKILCFTPSLICQVACVYTIRVTIIKRGRKDPWEPTIDAIRHIHEAEI